MKDADPVPEGCTKPFAATAAKNVKYRLNLRKGDRSTAENVTRNTENIS